jgi:hypothetical protein
MMSAKDMNPAIAMLVSLMGCTATSNHTRDAEPGQKVVCDGGPSTAPGNISWIVSYPTTQLIAQQSSQAAQLVQAYFNDARTFLVVRADDIAAAQMTFPKATLTEGFTDYTDDLAPALANGSIPAGVKAIYYDSEHWGLTPTFEQTSPKMYYAMAAQAVHDKGYQLLAVPATDLVGAIEPNFHGSSIYSEFLNLGIAGDAAKLADVYEMQSQGSERALDVFAPFVQNAARQARGANPQVRLLAGISTNPSSGDPTATELLAAVLTALGSVEGLWLNVPAPGKYCPACGTPRPDLAAALLVLLSQRC